MLQDGGGLHLPPPVPRKRVRVPLPHHQGQAPPRAALQPLTEASDSVAQGKELEERCQQLRAAAAEREYESLTADCSRRERDAAAAEPFSSYKEALGLGACTPHATTRG